MASISVDIDVDLDEFTDAELIEEMKLRELHVVDCNDLVTAYKVHGKEAFYEAAKRFVEDATGKILV